MRCLQMLMMLAFSLMWESRVVPRSRVAGTPGMMTPLKGNSSQKSRLVFRTGRDICFPKWGCFSVDKNEHRRYRRQNIEKFETSKPAILRLSRGSELTSGLSRDVKLSYAGGLFEQNNMENRGRVVVL